MTKLDRNTKEMIKLGRNLGEDAEYSLAEGDMVNAFRLLASSQVFLKAARHRAEEGLHERGTS